MLTRYLSRNLLKFKCVKTEEAALSYFQKCLNQKCCNFVLKFILVACTKTQAVTERLVDIEKYFKLGQQSSIVTRFKQRLPAIPIIEIKKAGSRSDPVSS